MAVIAQTIFDEGDWSFWEVNLAGDPVSGMDYSPIGANPVFSQRSTPFPTMGLGGGPCNTCNRNNTVTGTEGALYKVVGTVAPPSTDPNFGDPGTGIDNFAVRFQWGMFQNSSAPFGSSVRNMFALQGMVNNIGTNNSTVPSIRLYFTGTPGRLIARITNGACPSAVNAYEEHDIPFTFDGSNHAFQIVVQVTATDVTVEIVVDNVTEVLTTVAAGANACSGRWGWATSGTYCSHPCGASWVEQAFINLIAVPHWRSPFCGQSNWVTRMVEFVIDDDPVVVDYQPASIPNIGEFTCWQPPVIQTACVLGNGNIQLTGTGFRDETEFEVQAESGLVIGHTVVEVAGTSAELALNTAVDFAYPRYCFSATNPCD